MSVNTSDSIFSNPSPEVEAKSVKVAITVHDDIIAIINDLRDRVGALDGKKSPGEQEVVKKAVGFAKGEALRNEAAAIEAAAKVEADKVAADEKAKAEAEAAKVASVVIVEDVKFAEITPEEAQAKVDKIAADLKAAEDAKAPAVVEAPAEPVIVEAPVTVVVPAVEEVKPFEAPEVVVPAVEEVPAPEIVDPIEEEDKKEAKV